MKARVPVVFAPAAGSWLLGVLVIVSLVLLLRGGDGPATAGTAWRAYPDVLLLVALPLWYRYLPGAAAAAAALLALESALTLPAGAVSGGAAEAGLLLVCGVSLWALAGTLLRLWSRRRQERLARAAAGPARFPAPENLPRGLERRGDGSFMAGGVLCLVAAFILVEGIVKDFAGHGEPVPYDALGQQRIALPLLVLGTTLMGWGWGADRAARRLYEERQPVLVVGVRIARSGHFWLYPDPDDTSGRPLISCRPQETDSGGGGRLLAGGPEKVFQDGLHDIDPRSEPFEAVLYGVPREGAEIVLEYGVHEYGASLRSSLTASPLLPRRRHDLGPWTPAGSSYRASEQWQRDREAEAERERSRAQKASKRSAGTRATATGTSASTASGGTASGGGCGGDGGCGGGGGCGGCGCG
ncbi:hypothetical protein OOK31_25090 [Streptomyces sp. NBC_00249]|uniref:hypothetical protein n=1 Tax=Streptomyces sp. NBC_00249 TaxID=2975690 RepID=UPI0022506ADB|nr:hypothetical protein [Streptomyces sp. NBC_00249]MCX5197132.1 hypothetical protein [Streptomyces sp. NBC_00249]